MDLYKLFEDEGNIDELEACENLYSLFSDLNELYPNSPLPSLQQLSPPNELPPVSPVPFAPLWSELPSNQPQKSNKLFLPGLPSLNSKCPLVIKLEPLRCLFGDGWVRECERKACSPSGYDIVELVATLIDSEKICHKKPEELKAIMRPTLTSEERNKLIEVRRKLLRKRKHRKSSPSSKRSGPIL